MGVESWVQVRYEKISTFYFACDIIGHHWKSCTTGASLEPGDLMEYGSWLGVEGFIGKDLWNTDREAVDLGDGNGKNWLYVEDEDVDGEDVSEGSKSFSGMRQFHAWTPDSRGLVDRPALGPGFHPRGSSVNVVVALSSVDGQSKLGDGDGIGACSFGDEVLNSGIAMREQGIGSSKGDCRFDGLAPSLEGCIIPSSSSQSHMASVQNEEIMASDLITDER
ncbi:uncharacterized protein LOC132300786 [Cornus florida]|uniref:uncharacterized protein LOC132300786 n=1 Tax=Cornus florida TaxID=4283 RepID=UPI0028A048A4|nr:uncharacterized protein LOC132300786 [Cornus florida]